MQIEQRAVSELVPYENNPRDNDSAVDAVAASIKEFGFKVPIVINSDGVIIAGHTRLKAAKKLGLGTVPVIIANDLTAEQGKAFRLVDNKTSELAAWDFEKLEAELNDLKFIFDMDDFGFSTQESPEGSEPKDIDLSNRDFEKYEVVIQCASELEVQEVYQRLTEEGLTCRVLIS